MRFCKGHINPNLLELLVFTWICRTWCIDSYFCFLFYTTVCFKPVSFSNRKVRLPVYQCLCYYCYFYYCTDKKCAIYKTLFSNYVVIYNFQLLHGKNLPLYYTCKNDVQCMSTLRCPHLFMVHKHVEFVVYIYIIYIK